MIKINNSKIYLIKNIKLIFPCKNKPPQLTLVLNILIINLSNKKLFNLLHHFTMMKIN